MILIIIGLAMAVMGLLAWTGKGIRKGLGGWPVDSAPSKALGRAFTVFGLGIALFGVGASPTLRIVSLVVMLAGLVLLVVAWRRHGLRAPGDSRV